MIDWVVVEDGVWSGFQNDALFIHKSGAVFWWAHMHKDHTRSSPRMQSNIPFKNNSSFFYSCIRIPFNIFLHHLIFGFCYTHFTTFVEYTNTTVVPLITTYPSICITHTVLQLSFIHHQKHCVCATLSIGSTSELYSLAWWWIWGTECCFEWTKDWWGAGIHMVWAILLLLLLLWIELCHWRSSGLAKKEESCDSSLFLVGIWIHHSI